MNLEAWRKKNRASLADVAAGVATSRSHIWNIEAGKKLPSPELAKKIEAFTRGAVSAANLLGLTKKPRRGHGVQEEAEPFEETEELVIAVTLSADQSRRLRDLKVDIEAVAREGAERAIKEAQVRGWREANREAIEASKRWIEKNGTLAEQLGLI